MIAIIDYGAGNIRSVCNALHRLGANPVLSADEDTLRKADKVIFPGVGEAAYAMEALQTAGLNEVIPALSQPVLGICLGLQLMCRHSEEGNTAGLGIFPVAVKRFPATGKVPHMGWKVLQGTAGPLFEGMSASSDVYFVHSFMAGLSADTTATCSYLLPFSAALGRDNFHAVQFHPEKSGKTGALILKNFLEL